jgi:hypothetical protein
MNSLVAVASVAGRPPITTFVRANGQFAESVSWAYSRVPVGAYEAQPTRLASPIAIFLGQGISPAPRRPLCVRSEDLTDNGGQPGGRRHNHLVGFGSDVRKCPRLHEPWNSARPNRTISPATDADGYSWIRLATPSA